MSSREEKLRAGKFAVDQAMVQRLLAQQFPQWSDLPLRPVAADGWDNWTFHLGRQMKVRLPSAAQYAGQATKEAHWLPRLAPHLPVQVPLPAALGAPSDEFPWAWSIYDWIDGQAVGPQIDRVALAHDVASFINALQAIDCTGGPPPGQHNFFRGAHPMTAYGSEARAHIDQLGPAIDGGAAHAVLDAAERSQVDVPVWVHGDVAVGNLLTRDGRLSAVIDFGCLAVGDPSCDLVLAWTFLDHESRTLFRSLVDADTGTWERARAWALWKATLLATSEHVLHPAETPALDVIAAIVADYLDDQSR